MKRYYIDFDKEQLIDTEGKLIIDMYDKVDFYELCKFLNKEECEKIRYKMDLNNLKHKIRKLIE